MGGSRLCLPLAGGLVKTERQVHEGRRVCRGATALTLSCLTTLWRMYMHWLPKHLKTVGQMLIPSIVSEALSTLARAISLAMLLVTMAICLSLYLLLVAILGVMSSV